MIAPAPKFTESEYFSPEPYWRLKDGASEDDKRHLEDFMNNEGHKALWKALHPEMADPYYKWNGELVDKGHNDGGPGSGNFGHEGRPGEVGGSAPGNGDRAEAEGNDISRSYTGSRKTSDVLKAQGFDGLPKIVQKSEFDDAVQQSGFVAQRTYTASSQEILDQYRAQLYNGDFYVDCTVGGAQYGQGMYCAADYTGELTDGMKREMDHYRQLGQERALKTAWSEHMKSINPDTLRSFIHWEDFDVSDEEIRIFLKQKSNPYLTGYRLPDDEQKVWQKMGGKIATLKLALDAYKEEFEKGFKAPSYTETMTLSPAAKVVKYNDLVRMKDNVQADYEEKAFADYASEHGGEQCVAYLRSLSGRGSLDDFDVGDKFYLTSPNEHRAAQQFFNKLREESDQYSKKFEDMDIGAYAAMLGYDAINAEGHGATGSYTVILNRTKTIILGESAQTDSKSKNAVTFKEGNDGMLYAFQNGKVIGWVAVAQAETEDE